MIRTLTIRNLGPHAETTLALYPSAGTLSEWVDVHAPSTAGKSSLVLATTFALYGEEPDGTRLGLDAIADDADKAEVEMETVAGVTLSRSITRARSVRRRYERAGQPEVFPTSDREMLSTMGALGHAPDLARLVMVPMSWVPLALGEGQGRPLRDALARILPTAPIPDVVARLMAAEGRELRPTDPTDEPAAKKMVTDANRAAANRKGETQAIERSVVRAEERAQQAQGPSAADVSAARAVLDLDAAWSRYERLGAEAGAYEQEVAALDAWERRVAALGARPDDNAEAIRMADNARNLARSTAADKRRDLDHAGRALDDARLAERELRGTYVSADPDATATERTKLEAARKAAELARQQLDDDTDGLAKTREIDINDHGAVREALAAKAAANLARQRAANDAAKPAPDGPCDVCGSSEWPHAGEHAQRAAARLEEAEQALSNATTAHSGALSVAQTHKDQWIASAKADEKQARERFDQAAIALADAEADAERAATKAHAAAIEAHAAAIEAAVLATQQATAAVQRAEEAEREARVVLERAEAARDAAVQAGSAAREWDAASRALGARPTVRPAPTGADEPPTGPKPSPMELAGARAVLAQAEQAKGAASTRQDNVEELRADLDSARQRLAEAEAEAARADALLTCVRAAPSEAVRQSIEELDAGRLSLQLEGTGVQVLISGRRWQRASDGERIVADLEFRAALRRYLDLGQGRPATYLPLFVDRCQDVRGIPWPDVPGPVVRLWTSDGELRVERVEVAHG